MIYFILGKSNTGKDTITKTISEELKIPRIVSYTTRPRREGEVDGVDYHFVDDNFFITHLGEFIEVASYYIESLDTTWYYGKLKKDFNQDIAITILNPIGLESLKEIGLNNIVTIEISANDRMRLRRALQRDDDVEEIINRFQRDKKDFEGLMTDYTVYNETAIYYAVEEIKEIIDMNESEDYRGAE